MAYMYGKNILITTVSMYCEFKTVVSHWDFSISIWNLRLFIINAIPKGIGFQLESH